MSIDCSVVVWKRHFNGASRKMVAVKLSDWADNLGRGIWPSVETIATECDLSCRTVQRILSDFVDEGILLVVEKGGNGPKSTTRYDFNMAVVRALPLAVAPPDSKSAKGQNKGDTVSPLDEGKGDTDDAKGDTDDNKGDTVSPNPSGTTIEPSEERERASEDGEKGEDETVGERAFLRTMKIYPTGFDDDRDRARKAWFRLTTEKRLQVMRDLPAYIAAKNRVGRTKWCAFSTFLAQDRIDDLPGGKASALEGPKAAAPFGKAWMAALLCIVTERPGPMPAMPLGDRLLIDRDPDREIELRRAHQARHGWQGANRMLEKLREHKPTFVGPSVGRHGTDFQTVRHGGAIEAAWDRLAAARGLAWLPEQRPEWIWLPALPEGAEDWPESELNQAVGAAFEDFKRKVGHEHAA